MQTGVDSVHHQPTSSNNSLGISVEVKTDLEIIINMFNSYGTFKELKVPEKKVQQIEYYFL